MEMSKADAIVIVEKAIKLLTPIPDQDWIIGQFSNGRDKCCAIGHFRRLTSKNPNNYDKLNCVDEFNLNKERDLRGAFSLLSNGGCIAHINNEAKGNRKEVVLKALQSVLDSIPPN